MEDTLLGIQYTPQQEATLAEMERKAQDRIRVYNPTEENFTVLWGGLGFIIPAKHMDMGHGKGQLILPRYIAKNYVTKMTTNILGHKLVQAVKDANALRAERGQPAMNHWEERLNFEAPFRTDNEEARRNLIPLLWLGVEEEFGMEAPAQDTAHRRDPRSVDEQILAQLDRPARKLEEVELPSVPVAPDPVQVNETMLRTASTPMPMPATPIEQPAAQVAPIIPISQPISPMQPTSPMPAPVNPAIENLMQEISNG